jgi:hypothetical protein
MLPLWNTKCIHIKIYLLIIQEYDMMICVCLIEADLVRLLLFLLYVEAT